jgi:hypothetical protein
MRTRDRSGCRTVAHRECHSVTRSARDMLKVMVARRARGVRRRCGACGEAVKKASGGGNCARARHRTVDDVWLCNLRSVASHSPHRLACAPIAALGRRRGLRCRTASTASAPSALRQTGCANVRHERPRGRGAGETGRGDRLRSRDGRRKGRTDRSAVGGWMDVRGWAGAAGRCGGDRTADAMIEMVNRQEQ